MKNRPLHERLLFALNGLGTAWRREHSFRVQTVLAILAIVILIVLHPPLIWWAFVAVMISLVLAVELMNSGLEALVDLLHPGRDPAIRAIKDMAAASVLLASVGALVVGGLLLLAILWP
jgi:diacylglycerol kinase